jgi:acylphosphatase
MATINNTLILTGKVQGVFFRDFAKQNANKLGIVGYARNRKDGSLEIVCQGDERKMEEFTKLCRRGPIFAKVDSVTVEKGDVDEEMEYFDIRYS